jgi:hypothetical protein
LDEALLCGGQFWASVTLGGGGVNCVPVGKVRVCSTGVYIL